MPGIFLQNRSWKIRGPAWKDRNLSDDNADAFCLWSRMFLPAEIFVASLALLCLSGFAAEPPESPAPPRKNPLTREEIAAAAKTDSLSIPTPGELMAALQKQGKLDWAAQFRPPIATNFSSRAQMALNLGGLIADGYIAVEAEDSQQVKNIGKDIVALAKPLGVQQDIINRGKSLSDFAEQNKWEVLKEELEATQNEVKIAMADNKDQNLITLVTVGGWVRGTGEENHVATSSRPRRVTAYTTWPSPSSPFPSTRPSRSSRDRVV